MREGMCVCMCVRVHVLVILDIYFIFVRKYPTPPINEGLRTELHFDIHSLKDFHTYTIQNLSIAI
jgi:hypothetical protein